MADRANELDTAFHNVLRLVEAASALMLNSMSRVSEPGRGDEYRMPREEAEQLSALLIVTADYARREIGEGIVEQRVGA